MFTQHFILMQCIHLVVDLIIYVFYHEHVHEAQKILNNSEKVKAKREKSCTVNV